MLFVKTCSISFTRQMEDIALPTKSFHSVYSKHFRSALAQKSPPREKLAQIHSLASLVTGQYSV